VEGVEPNAVHELRRTTNIPNRQIATFTLLKGSNFVGKAECPRRVSGDAYQALVNREAKKCGSHVHREQ
jgi:hypothetical protein